MARKTGLWWVAVMFAAVFAIGVSVPAMTADEPDDVGAAVGSTPTPTASGSPVPTTTVEPSEGATGGGTPSPSASPTTLPGKPSKRPRPKPTGKPTTGEGPAAEPARPNILLISTDDQTDYEYDYMPLTRKALGAAGLEFTDAIADHPICCPARAEILTGEYAQNSGVWHNEGPLGGYDQFMDNTGDDHLGVWLQDAGYRTAFIGKNLNKNVEDGRPMPGWDMYDSSMEGTYAYHSTTFWNDGEPVTYGPDDYVADVVADRSIDLIEEYTAEGKPFFLWVSHLAPHDASDSNGNWGPPIPAPRHEGLFGDLTLENIGTPSFREQDLSDKPGAIRNSQDRRPVEALTGLYRDRVRSLQAVDEANAAMIDALARAGQLDNTYVFFVSDNGFQLGEHGLFFKNWPYEETLQIPFVVRGPGVPAGRTTTERARLVDLAPTFLDIAGVLRDVRATGRTDGVSLLPVFGGGTTTTTSLIQAGTDNPAALSATGWRWRGVRTPRFTYVLWWFGREELYDRAQDPQQLANLVRPDGTLRDTRYAATLAEMQRRYQTLQDCDGPQQCQQDFGLVPGPR